MSHRKLLSLALALTAIPALAVAPGNPAPDFKGTDSNGVTHSLSQYRGKYVVLEWANKGCPFEQKYYLSGSMENLQKEWTAKGVVWLSVISSASGERGYVTPSEENTYLKTMHAAPTAALLDPTGKLIYDGAIDNKPTTDQADLKGADNYLNDALNASMAGKPIAVESTRPYGCSVKYAH